MAALIEFLIVWTITVLGLATAYRFWIRYIRPPMPGDYTATFDDWFCLWICIALPASIYLGGHAYGY